MSASSNYPGYYPPSAQRAQPTSYASNSSLSQRSREPQAQQGPSPSSSSSVPIDPSLSMYSSQYYTNTQYQHRPLQPPQQLSVSANISSPSSQASETVATSPTEHRPTPGPPTMNSNGKRTASPTRTQPGDARKKSRKDDDGDEAGSGAEKDDTPKQKSTRGSRCVLPCYALLMRLYARSGRAWCADGLR